MSYITGTVTDANPAAALYALMAPALTTAGYTLVDTVVISTRTHKVWKSAAANNTQGLDWYLDVTYTTTGAGSVWIIPFENFDPATDLGYRGPYSNSSSLSIDATYYSRYGATGNALETNWVSATQSTIRIMVATTSFGYWISITGDRVAAMTSELPSNLVYAGMYKADTLHAAKAGAGLFPLIVATIVGGSTASSASSAATSALCRIPPYTTLTGSGWGASHVVSAVPPPGPGTPSTTPGYPNVAGMLPITSGATFPAFTFGWLIDVAALNTTNVTRGDTVTIDGVSWVLTTGATSAIGIKAV